MEEQLDIFGSEARTPRVASAPFDESLRTLGSRLPAALRLGTSSWSYPGWEKLVFDRRYTTAQLSQDGLPAYAQHPLLRWVGIDRSFYGPLPPGAFQRYAAQTPDDFRFVVKSQQIVQTALQDSQPNPLFLDAAYATDSVVGPAREGLGAKLAFILFQFPPQDVLRLGGAAGVDGFVNRLYRFLRALPTDVRYAVEVRTPALFTQRYAQALLHTKVLPALAGWNGLPSLREQAALTHAHAHDALFIRWMLHEGLRFEEAEQRYEPFDRMLDPDPETRREAVQLTREALAAGKPAYVVIGNQAEGCSPRSHEAFARELTGAA